MISPSFHLWGPKSVVSPVCWQVAARQWFVSSKLQLSEKLWGAGLPLAKVSAVSYTHLTLPTKA